MYAIRSYYAGILQYLLNTYFNSTVYHFFTEELNQIVQNTINLDKDMRQALTENEYCLYYQPKVDLLTSKIVGVEALIRWISPTKGFIPPNVFIPLAEENGS